MPKAEKTPKSSDKVSKPTSEKGEQNLVTDTLCDENWKCDIVLIYEGDKDGLNFVNILQQIPTKQITSGVKVVNKNELLKDIKKSKGKSSKASSKSQKGKDMVVELTDEQKIMKCVKDNLAIPGAALASVVKKCLFSLKVEDINARKKMLSAFQDGKKKKPKSKEKKERETDEKPPDVFVEKPRLFVVLLGFKEHDLPLELIKQDIPICGVIKVVEKQRPTEHKSVGSLLENQPSSTFGSVKFNMSWLLFWRQYNELMDIPENADLGSDLAAILYEVPQELMEPKVNLKDKKTIAINQLAEIMNYVQNLLERHMIYCEQNNVIDVGADLAKLESSDLYNTLVQMVPLECISIPTILFALIEQVCHWKGDEIDIENNNSNVSRNIYNNNTNNNNSIGNDESDEKSKTNKSNNSDENKCRLTLRSKCSSTSSVNSKKNQPIIKTRPKCSPAIIRHNDEHSLRTFHLEIPEIDFDKIIHRFLSKSYLLNFWSENNKIDPIQKYYLEFHLQTLWKLTYKDMHLNLFYIYLHWYILCKMKSYFMRELEYVFKNEDGTITDADNVGFSLSRLLTKNELLTEWIDETFQKEQTELSGTNTNSDCHEQPKPRPNSQYNTADKITKERNHNLLVLKKFLFCAEILCLCDNKEPPAIFDNLRLLANYKYIEEMTPLALLQILHEATFNYSVIQNLYYYPSNRIMVWFYNVKDFIFEEHKRGEIDTVLGFHDYYNHIIETEKPSLLEPNEETNDAKNKNQSTEDNLGTGRATGSIIDEDKHETMAKNTGDENNENKPETRSVYNVGKKMMRFDQSTRRFFSEDGSSVTVKIEDWYHSSQFVNICIAKIDTEMNIYIDQLSFTSGNYDNENYVSNSRGPVEIIKVSLKLPNEILLNVNVQEVETTASEGDSLTSQFVFNNLTITIPNGLIIEVKNNSSEENGIYIKQSYTDKGPNCNKIWDEKWRCFLKSGAVVILKNDDTIDVLYGNTVYCKINKLEESLDQEEIMIPEVVGTNTPEKEKSGKKIKSAGKKTKGHTDEVPNVEPIEKPEKVQTLFKVIEHSIKSWSGINYDYKVGSDPEIVDNNVNLRTIFEPSTHLYIDRNDGIKCLFNEEGHLVSTFNDGTILTTYPFEEIEQLVTESKETSVRLGSELSISEETPEDNSITSHQIEEDSYNEFVSYRMGCIAKHPNYAEVEFVASNESIKLTLPQNIMVIIKDIKTSGSYNIKVDVNKKASFCFTEQSIDFKSNILKNTNNNTQISPILSDGKMKSTTEFCKTTDSFNRTFLVDKKGYVRLEEPESQGAMNQGNNVTETDFYYENTVPKKLTERFFVVNDDFSGYEVVKESDISLLDKEDENRFKNVQVAKNPTNNRVLSKSCQYLVRQTRSDIYLLQQNVNFNDTIPMTFQKKDLGPIWTPKQSPWFFVRSDSKRSSYRNISFCNIPRHTDERILAVVVKTVQKVSDSNGFNGIDIILNCLEKYVNENKKICKKYRQQGYTDYNIDQRMQENHELTNSIKKQFPLWNVIRKDCNLCKQTLSTLDITDSSTLIGEQVKGGNTEKCLIKTDFATTK